MQWTSEWHANNENVTACNISANPIWFESNKITLEYHLIIKQCFHTATNGIYFLTVKAWGSHRVLKSVVAMATTWTDACVVHAHVRVQCKWRVTVRYSRHLPWELSRLKDPLGSCDCKIVSFHPPATGVHCLAETSREPLSSSCHSTFLKVKKHFWISVKYLLACIGCMRRYLILQRKQNQERSDRLCVEGSPTEGRAPRNPVVSDRSWSRCFYMRAIAGPHV